jgi:hypothetical protein
MDRRNGRFSSGTYLVIVLAVGGLIIAFIANEYRKAHPPGQGTATTQAR